MSNQSDPFGTSPMFEVPEGSKRPAKEDDPEAIRWTTYKGKRTGCDDCVADIVNGGYRYMAEPASQLRVQGPERLYLCGAHASRRKVADDLV